jgi:medium-chain acyl-[acyl-carrier-protein] hydrolase
MVRRHWSIGMPPDVELCAIQLPGREDRVREPPMTSFPELAAAIAYVLPLDRPFGFFGHSLGALIAFEVARELRRRGLPGPASLVVSGAHAPQMPFSGPQLGDLPDSLFLDHIRSLDGTSDEALQHADLMQVLLPALRADFRLYEDYRYLPQPPLGCPIRAFGGLDDATATEGDIAQWRAQTSASFAVRMFEGGHFFIWRAHGAVRDVVLGELSVAVGVGRGGSGPYRIG